VELPAAEFGAEDSIPASPEDFWSPALDIPEGLAMEDVYGPITPVPNHDGTMCFKWDNTLWSAEGHFRVRVHAGAVSTLLWCAVV
jgi:1,4-alpha-glucan branching enzyme